MPNNVYVQGAEELRAKFRTLTPKIEKKVLTKSLRSAGKIEQAKAKELVPYITGLTRRAVKLRAMKRKKGRVGVNVMLSAGSFSDAFYATFPEYGTKFQEAQHNLEQAAEQTHPQALEQFKKEAGAMIEKEAAA